MSALTFQALTPEHLTAWLAFFDGPAFADNPEWGTCYCRCFLMPPQGDRDQGIAAWDAACAAGANRAPMIDRIGQGQVDGVLAFVGDQVVGWLHLGPVGRFCAAWGPSFVPAPGDAAAVGQDGQAAIVCFLVAQGHRRQGVGRGMLTFALDELRRRGFRSVVAKAAGPAIDAASDQFTGPLSLYTSLGFQVVRDDARRPLVARDL